MTLPHRIHGTSGPTVVLLHGGPGAPGVMGGVAAGLADRFRVLEPFQRDGGAEPLTVARHVEDLREFLEEVAGPGPRAVVGSSWGAMLALAWAAAHPVPATPLVLVGCGTFDARSRAAFLRALDARRSDGDRRRAAALAGEVADPDERLRRLGDLLLPAYAVDPVTTDLGCRRCSDRANRETWSDMLRLQRSGVYPAAFAAITAPVLMLHGADDPHPGAMVRDSLLPHLPRLEYREWPRCGHYPWIERAAREPFFATLREWLAARLAPTAG